jgi:phosphatidate cytidylyltransferase
MTAKSSLGTRSLSALLLAPPVLAAIYFGPPYSDVLVVVAAGLMMWEWARLCSRGRFDLASGLTIVAMVFAVLLGAFAQLEAAFAALAVGAAGAAGLGYSRGRERAFWLGLGVVYLGLACLAFQWLRVPGRDLVIWLLLVIWATDIGAYFAGRSIGGPKLAPRISPKKTWAAAAVAGLAGIWLDDFKPLPWNLLLAMVLAVVSQMGDLLESHLKRRYDAKDSSNLIPGHGGVLDRTDGLMAASLMLALVVLMTRGS